jgi:hypothetical protein
MLKLSVVATFAFFMSLSALAQAEHESFTKDNELLQAVVKKNITPFASEPFMFICDTMEKQVTDIEANQLLALMVPTIKGSVINKASETNHGYVQTFGLYKNDDALYYIRLSLSPLSGKIEEIEIKQNN